MEAVKERQPALDGIRAAAIFFVVSVHFFLYIDFYGVPVVGGRMLAFTAIRGLSMVCVPLFLMLSGYLQRGQLPRQDYYRRIGRILGTYLLASLVCFCFRRFWLKEELGVLELPRSLLNFSATPYGWYIEMYLGLFLLIPFLNLLYRAVPTRRWKGVLLGTLALMAILPFTVNYFKLDPPGWLSNPAVEGEPWKLLPNWWYQLYPLFFYFLGSYLREYGSPLRPLACLGLGLGVLALGTAFDLWMSGDCTLRVENWNQTGTLFPAVLAYLVFVFLLKLPWGKAPRWVTWGLGWISRLSLGTYLVSYCFERLFYRLLKARVTGLPNRLLYYLPLVLAVLLASTALSWVLWQLQRCLSRLGKRRGGG